VNARQPCALRVRRVGPDGALAVGGAELLDGPGNKWIDLESPDEATLQGLAERFQLHRLAVEDALHLDQRPKLEEYPSHLFLVLQGFTEDGGDICQLTMHEMHFFLGKDWVMTAHDRPHVALRGVAHRVDEDPSGTLGRGPDFVAYLVADGLVDQHFPILDKVGDAIEETEDHVFERADVHQLERMFELRKLLAHLRRVLSPQRDVVSLLSRSGVTFIQQRTTLYFRDVGDHLFRLYEQLDSSRELLGSVKDAYLAMVAQRTNEITKQLTLFATLFLPLSFVVGFFGQNFEPLGRAPFFWVMIASLGLVPAGTFVWFRHRQWL
jgi:magnesium transporter